MTTLTIPARDVQVGDRVLDEQEPFVVGHAMTCGKKARVTTLAPVAFRLKPRHYAPDALLTVERKEASR